MYSVQYTGELQASGRTGSEGEGRGDGKTTAARANVFERFEASALRPGGGGQVPGCGTADAWQEYT